MVDYGAIATETVNKVLKYNAEEDWVLCKSGNDVQVYNKPSPDFNGYLYKAVYSVDASPEKCLDLVWDTEKHVQFDRAIKEMTVLETISEDAKLLRTSSASLMLGLVSPRDFVDVFGIRRMPDSGLTIVYFSSIEHADHPAPKGVVRGTNYPSAFLFYAVDGNPNKTKAVNVTQFEGHLSPKSLVERFIPKLHLDFVEDFRKGVNKY